MPRKHIKGRSRLIPIDKASSINRQLIEVNKRLDLLRSQNLQTTYSAKKLINRLQSDNLIKINLSKKSRKLSFKTNISSLSAAQIRYYSKVFQQFLKSKASTPAGIKQIRNESRNTLKETLGEITDSNITDEDVDDFYDLLYDPDFNYLAEKIDPSELYILLMSIKNSGGSKKDFINLINQYITSNNQETRQSATRLYNKFVRS